MVILVYHSEPLSLVSFSRKNDIWVLELIFVYILSQHQHMIKMSSVFIQMRDSVMDLRKCCNDIEKSFPAFDLQVPASTDLVDFFIFWGVLEV